jgi:hypothetical protein
VTGYDPPAIQVLGTIDELTAGKPIAGSDQIQGSVPQDDS